MKYKPLPPAEELRAAFDYDPETGVMTWKTSPLVRIKSGTPAGTANSKGYLRVCFRERNYMVHRIIWCWVTGVDPAEHQIDHVDVDTSNNRWCNLRLATESQNCHNSDSAGRRKGLRCPKGMTWSPSGLKWAVSVSAEGCVGYQGLHEDLDVAEALARSARSCLHGAFANHGVQITEDERAALKEMQKSARDKRDARIAARKARGPAHPGMSYQEVATLKRHLARVERDGYESIEAMLRIEAERKEYRMRCAIIRAERRAARILR